MVSFDNLRHIVQLAVKSELNGNRNFHYDENTIRYIVFHSLITHQDTFLNGEHVNGSHINESNQLIFEPVDVTNRSCSFSLSLLKSHQDFSNVRINHKFNNYMIVLLQASEEQRIEWIKNHLAEDSLYRLVTVPAKVSADPLWMIIFEAFPPVEVTEEGDLNTALTAAIESMQYEKLLATIRQILMLQTNVPENEMGEDETLRSIFLKSFAKEQGVAVEEVHDPVVMNNITDSQLAASNFIEDIRKVFHVDSQWDAKITTLQDLALFALSRIKHYA